jgi:hypothetical protein
MPKPKPPTDEEYEAWLDHPITAFVLDCYERMADEQRQAWMLSSWEAGDASLELLIELRTRSDAYKSMAECDLGDLVAVNEKDTLHVVPKTSL